MAGEIRTIYHRATLIYLEAAFDNIDKMSQSNFDEIVEKKYVGMNIAPIFAPHPPSLGIGVVVRSTYRHKKAPIQDRIGAFLICFSELFGLRLPCTGI